MAARRWHLVAEWQRRGFGKGMQVIQLLGTQDLGSLVNDKDDLPFSPLIYPEVLGRGGGVSCIIIMMIAMRCSLELEDLQPGGKQATKVEEGYSKGVAVLTEQARLHFGLCQFCHRLTQAKMKIGTPHHFVRVRHK